MNPERIWMLKYPDGTFYRRKHEPTADPDLASRIDRNSADAISMGGSRAEILHGYCSDPTVEGSEGLLSTDRTRQCAGGPVLTCDTNTGHRTL
jgi:hypothetical protein